MANLQDLRYFSFVARTLNVTRAAELAGVSQPALSHSLKRLESEIGAKLLERGKSGVRLTRAGSRFAAEAAELAQRWGSIVNTVRADSSTVSGSYRFGCHASVAIYSLPKFLADLQLKYPSLEIALTHGLSREVVSDVISWRLDLALAINPTRHPDLVIRDLGTDQVTLWKSPRIRCPDTLILDPDLFQARKIVDGLGAGASRFTRRIESSSLEVIRALTLSGCGVGILPARVAGTGLRRVAGPVVHDRLCLIYRAGTQHSAGARAIIEAVTKAGI